MRVSRRRILAGLGATALLSGCNAQRDPGTIVFLIENSPTTFDPRIEADAQSERINQLIIMRKLCHKTCELPDETWSNSAK